MWVSEEELGREIYLTSRVESRRGGSYIPFPRLDSPRLEPFVLKPSLTADLLTGKCISTTQVP